MSYLVGILFGLLLGLLEQRKNSRLKDKGQSTIPLPDMNRPQDKPLPPDAEMEDSFVSWLTSTPPEDKPLTVDEEMDVIEGKAASDLNLMRKMTENRPRIIAL
jgi:hypothetical protein